ncbi:MAG: ribbon-helix-helix protein, CopG family [Thermoplasmata archaeon]|nr:ribbon-helix-helix protein, CopG family [Thermoplasmata archaeon]
MSVALSVRLPEEVMRELEEVASLLDRPKTYIVRKALEAYLEEYVDYLVALERLRDKDDRIISGEELREQLGL